MFGSERNNLITWTSRYIRIRKSWDFLNLTVSASTVSIQSQTWGNRILYSYSNTI